MKEIIFKILAVVLFAGLVVASTIGVIGCQSAPKRSDYESDECFYNADCLYRNEKNPDKSACSVLSESCANSSKEIRAYGRLKFCSEKKPKDMTENECRLYLNQK
jgi:hypothetical protein